MKPIRANSWNTWTSFEKQLWRRMKLPSTTSENVNHQQTELVLTTTLRLCSFLHKLKRQSKNGQLDRVKRDKLGLITVEEGVRLPGEPALDGSVEVDEAEKVSFTSESSAVQRYKLMSGIVLAEVDCTGSGSTSVITLNTGSLRSLSSTNRAFQTPLQADTPISSRAAANTPAAKLSTTARSQAKQSSLCQLLPDIQASLSSLLSRCRKRRPCFSDRGDSRCSAERSGGSEEGCVANKFTTGERCLLL